MSETGLWVAKIPNLTPDTALEISEQWERLQDDPAATHHAVASFCAGDVDDWAVEISFAARPGDAYIAELLAPYRDRSGAVPSAQLRPVEDRDWVQVTLRNLPPVRAGRFYIHGQHNRDARAAGSVAIEIEANQAFGTGHHETTAGCLEALDQELRRTRYRNCLDLGCGSAVLAIAIAKATRERVLATDIDPVAVEIAKENARLNNVSNLVHCVVADGLNHPRIRTDGKFDLVMANILSGPLIALANPLHDCVAPGGTVVLSGILVRQAPGVEAAYRAAGFNFRRRLIKGEWAALVLRNQGRP